MGSEAEAPGGQLTIEVFLASRMSVETLISPHHLEIQLQWWGHRVTKIEPSISVVFYNEPTQISYIILLHGEEGKSYMKAFGTHL